MFAMLATMVAVGAVGGSLWYFFMRPDRTAADRIAAFTGVDEAPKAPTARSLGVVTRTAARLASSGDQDEIASLRKRLGQAGYRGKDAPMIYSALRTFLLVILGLLGFLVLHKAKLTYAAFGTFAGVFWLLPSHALD